jgi:hypothetical protein
LGRKTFDAMRALPATVAADDPWGMKSRGFTYWRDEEAWLGYLDEFPDYLTQGDSLEDLKDHLFSLYEDLVSGDILCVRHHGELL